MFCGNGVSAALMGFLLPNLDKKGHHSSQTEQGRLPVSVLSLITMDQ